MSRGQHVGSLADAIVDDSEREAQHKALKRVMKPSGRAFTGKSDSGNGEVCPADPEHGKMFNMPGSGNDWCPHSDHSSGKKSYSSAPILGSEL